MQLTSGDWVAIVIGGVAVLRSGAGWALGAFGKDQSRLQDLREKFIEFRAENRVQHENGMARIDAVERRMEGLQIQVRALAPGGLGKVVEYQVMRPPDG